MTDPIEGRTIELAADDLWRQLGDLAATSGACRGLAMGFKASGEKSMSSALEEEARRIDRVVQWFRSRLENSG